MKSNDVTVVISNKRKECYSLVLAFTLNVLLYIRCCILIVGGGTIKTNYQEYGVSDLKKKKNLLQFS